MRELQKFIHELQANPFLPKDEDTQRLLALILTEIEKQLYSVENERG